MAEQIAMIAHPDDGSSCEDCSFGIDSRGLRIAVFYDTSLSTAGCHPFSARQDSIERMSAPRGGAVQFRAGLSAICHPVSYNTSFPSGQGDEQ